MNSAVARRHASLAGAMTAATGAAVPILIAVLAHPRAPSTHTGDVADPGGIVAGSIVFILLAIGLAIAALAVCGGWMMHRNPARYRIVGSLLGAVGLVGGVAEYADSSGSPPLRAASVVVAMYGAVMIGLVIPMYVERSPLGDWLRRRGALVTITLSIFSALPFAGMAGATMLAVAREEKRPHASRKEMALARDQCDRALFACMEGLRPADYCGSLESVATSPDGAYAASVGERFHVWGIAEPRRLGMSQLKGDSVTITGPFRTMGPWVAVCRGWACDLLVGGGADRPESIPECSDGDVPADAHPRAPFAFAPDSSRFAIAGDALCVHELPSGWRQRRFAAGCANRYDAVAFSPDGTTVAAICDGLVSLWDASTGVRRDTGAPRVFPRASRSGLAFASDGRAVIVLAREERGDVLYSFDATDGSTRARVEIGAGNRPTAFAVLPEMRVLVGGEKTCVWDLAREKLVRCANEPSDFLSASTGGTSPMVAISGANARTDAGCASTPTIRVWKQGDLDALSAQ